MTLLCGNKNGCVEGNLITASFQRGIFRDHEVSICKAPKSVQQTNEEIFCVSVNVHNFWLHF